MENENEKKELKTETKPKEYEKIEAENVRIVDIIRQTDSDEKTINKIRFVTEDKEITWKPKHKTQIETKERGLKSTKQETKHYEVNETPEKVFELNNIIQEKGFVDVVMSYTIWHTKDKNNEPMTYYFMNNEEFESIFIKEEK